MAVFTNNNPGKVSRKDSKAISYLQYAQKCKAEGKFETMLDYMDKAFKLKPDSYLLMNKAKVLEHLKEYEKALETINRAIEMETNHLYFIIKAQIQASLSRFEDSLESIESAIAIHNCAYYQAAKAQMLFISGRVLDGIDHLLWIRENYSNLADREDLRFLSSILLISKTYHIEFPKLEYQLINAVKSAQEPNRSQIVRFLIDIDLFSHLKEAMDPNLVNEIISSDSVSNEEKVVFLYSICNWDQATATLEKYRPSLDNEFYQFIRAGIDLDTKGSCSIDTIKHMIQWNLDAKHVFINKLWNKKQYESLREYFLLEKPSTVPSKWMQFWSTVLSGDLQESSVLLEDIPQGLEEIFRSRRTSNSFEREVFGLEVGDNNLNNNLEVILELFPFELPYDLLTWDLFICVIKKIFPVQYSSLIALQAELIAKQGIGPSYMIDNEKYREYYHSASMKVDLINNLSLVFISGGSSHFAASLSIVIGASRRLVEKMHTIVDSSREEERNKILSDLSHSIKNLLRSVIDPLINIRKELPGKNVVIDDAIKGASLIREMVNSINFSYTANVEDLLYDIENPGLDSLTLQSMIVNSLNYAIGNMFDSKYFSQFMRNYFQDRSTYEEAVNAWDSIYPAGSILSIKEFSDRYMFILGSDIDSIGDFKLGNDKSSAIKLMILFQEIILNAVKYVSYVERDKRFVKVSFLSEGNNLVFVIENSYDPGVQAKTTGLGHVIIRNFTKVLDCEPEIVKSDKVYSLTVKFRNYWREDGKDTVH